MTRIAALIFAIISCKTNVTAQMPAIQNVYGRNTISLNGTWQYIIDPYETGFYDYRYQERATEDRDAYWNSDLPKHKSDRLEHGYSSAMQLKVPGDWNSQEEKLLYYEGTIWYKKSFDANVDLTAKTVLLHFGAVNYKADVYLNGAKLGSHIGGFSAFNFAVDKKLLKTTGNSLVVKVDNKRGKNEIPTLNTDWWNYGGITRDVQLVILPENYISNYFFTLIKNEKAGKTRHIEGWIKFSGRNQNTVSLEIPELKIKKEFKTPDDSIHFLLPVKNLKLWSPENPKLYEVMLTSGNELLKDKIGFKTIATEGKNILLNDRPVFLRGICIHEEIPQEGRRATSYSDALQLLSQARALNANMVRLAHYPHNEFMLRIADSLGLMVWSEIPVYWTINFTSEEVLQKAKTQLDEMIGRDRNRASIIIWSVGNETPVHEARTIFMTALVMHAKQADSSRLVAAALESSFQNGKQLIADPLGKYTDIVAVNEYIGWYGGLPDRARTIQWETIYDKPLFFSETGAEAVGGLHADSASVWSEEFQEWYYKEQVGMMKRMPDNYVGLSPWILNDFRSPRRNNPKYQQGWNNKGLYDHHGNRKKAFYILKAYYDEMEKRFAITP